MIVVAADPAYLIAVEVWFALFDGCGELTDAHVYGENGCVLAFQARLFLDGDVHEPVLSVSDEFAFTCVILEQWFLLVW